MRTNGSPTAAATTTCIIILSQSPLLKEPSGPALQVGTAATLLDQSRARDSETNLGSYLCDALIRFIKKNTTLESTNVGGTMMHDMAWRAVPGAAADCCHNYCPAADSMKRMNA